MKIPEGYTESLVYQMELTTRYFKLLISQVFSKLEIDITPENYAVLDILAHNDDLCQRDLAKILLKDRANTGKIITILEEKNLVKRFIDTKGKRLVKKIKITSKGLSKIRDISKKLAHISQRLDKTILVKEQQIVIKSLNTIKEFLKANIETSI